MKMTNRIEAFANAYLAGNEAAQVAPASGLYALATDAGYQRGTLEWEAFVAGGAAFLFNGHTFKTKAR
jgi:hypothetical protein